MLDGQSLKRELFTVLVVDNSLSPGRSESFRASLPDDFNGVYIVTEKAGLSYARNVALEKCKTPYIAYVDDDALVATDWAERVLGTFERYHGGAGIVGGKVLPIYEAEKPSWLAGELLHYLAIPDWGDTELVLKRDSGKWLVGASIAYDTQALRRAGGFPENLGRSGDLLLCHEEFWINEAIRAQGYSVIYNPMLVAEHLIQRERMTQEWLCKAAFWEAASWMVCCNLDRVDDLAADTKTCSLLSGRLDELLGTTTVDPTTDAVRDDCLRFKAAGRQIMRENGFPLDSPPASTGYPTVFIVTTCMNAGDTIERTLASVIQQAGDFYLRYHVQDGGSKDNTLEAVERWRLGLEDGSVRTHCKGVAFSYASERDAGMYDGICKAFEHFDMPRDAFMTWLNADDMLFSGALATIADLQRKQEQVLWVTGEIYCTRFNGGLCQATACGFPRWFIQNGLCETRFWQFLQQEGTFWRKSLWDAVSGLNRSMKLAGDYDLWRRFATKAELWHFLGPLASFQRRPGQLSEDLGSYCEEIDSVIPREEKETAWQWIETELRNNPDKFHISCLYYDWGADAYKVTYPSLKDFAPPWKKEMFGDRSTHAHAPAPTPAAAPPQPLPAAEKVESPEEPGLGGQPIIHVVPDPHPGSKTPPASEPPSPNAAKPEKRCGMVGRIKGSVIRARQYRKIRQSGLFLDAYYLERYPDVQRTGMDPLLHYMQHGWREGRNPNPLFNTVYYLRSNRDVEDSGVNPLLHYVEHGYREGRAPSATFRKNRYIGLTPQLHSPEASPLLAYLHREEKGNVRGDVADPDMPAQKHSPSESSLRPSFERPASGADSLLVPANFAAFTYSKRSHFRALATYAEDFYGKPLENIDTVELKYYQRLLAYAFIRQNVAPGSRILEVGGGNSIILRRLGEEYECWNLDRFEGLGNGPVTAMKDVPWKNVLAYIGENSDELPSDYFDLVFSVSVLEHTARDDQSLDAILADLSRVTRSGGNNVHLLDARVTSSGIMCHPIVWRLAQLNVSLETSLKQERILADFDLYTMSKQAYEQLWQQYSGQDWDTFGRPFSINLVWKHTR